MLIECPTCQARYRIDPSASKADVAKVKCPGCQHVFEVSLVAEDKLQQDDCSSARPVVLVVDDARFFRELIKDILLEEGWNGKKVRERLHLRTGDKLDFRVEDDGTIRIYPIARKVSEVFGVFAEKAKRAYSAEETREQLRKAFRKRQL